MTLKPNIEKIEFSTVNNAPAAIFTISITDEAVTATFRIIVDWNGDLKAAESSMVAKLHEIAKAIGP